MPEYGNIDLTKVKASYNLDDFNLVDINKVNSINESRLYFEVAFAFGIPLSVLFAEDLAKTNGQFNVSLFISSIAFMGFGIFMLIRYINKHKNLVPIQSNESILSEFESLKKFLSTKQHGARNYCDILGDAVREHGSTRFQVSETMPQALLNEYELKKLCLRDEANYYFSANAFEFVNWMDLHN